MKLGLLSDDLSHRSNKNFDYIKIRYELEKKVREKDHLISDLKSEVTTAKSELSANQERNAELQSNIESKDAVIETLSGELESTRGFLESAESRLKRVEAENVLLSQRLLDEKHKNAEAMNEMNRIMQQQQSSTGSLIGGGLNLMKKFGATSLFVKSSGHEEGEGEHDIEDDFVDIKGSEEPDLPVVVDVAPPRRPMHVTRCHGTEINDVVYERQKFMTAGSDSTVRVFPRRGSGTEGDGTPDGELADALLTLTAGGPVISLHLAGEWIAGGCSDRIGRIWSTRTGRLRHNLSGHANRVSSVRLIGSGEERAVTGSADRTIKFWDITRSQANALCSMKTNSCVDSVGVSSDCSTVASGHQDGGLRLWNLQTRDKIHFLPKLHSSHITCVQFDPKRSAQILTASRDNTLTITDTRTYEPLTVLRAPGFTLSSDWCQVTYSPDCAMVVAGGADGSLYLWNTLSGDFIGSYSGHKAGITSVFWGDTGVMSCDKDGNVIQWG
eukprot:CAMPEP_0185023368 /NCGR_PEP_ID=MMETSP1103-20130426/6050_1 /TAXON_ID=36769 /ORGANISM="Paraphysomonas bandaiensis, Strain Caron Lab Isolate" /LENGTH=497 /DNA_ID=CAMNT_0027555929 /DNA_START=278 /DNA_END=1771 /DNA_ORIENTATION=-